MSEGAAVNVETARRGTVVFRVAEENQWERRGREVSSDSWCCFEEEVQFGTEVTHKRAKWKLK